MNGLSGRGDLNTFVRHRPLCRGGRKANQYPSLHNGRRGRRHIDVYKYFSRKYKQVIEKFDTFFGVRKNVIFERVHFNRRCQNEGEFVEQFITNLYQLAENCQYGAMKEEMIREQIVIWIKDTGLSLEKAKTKVRQIEAVQEHQQMIKGGFKPTLTPSSVDAVRRRQHNSSSRPSRTRP